MRNPSPTKFVICLALLAIASLRYPDILSDLEKRSGGRLGVYAEDLSSHKIVEHRMQEKFLLCSTFKFLAVGAVLRRVDRHLDSLKRNVAYAQKDLQEYAPITKNYVSTGTMGLSKLCGAAVEYSDNTAANLILKRLGGPRVVTEFSRKLGDPTTRLDQYEPELNTPVAGSSENTTSPIAIAHDLVKLGRTDFLSYRSRVQLVSWMKNCKTSGSLIRAGVPKGWVVADKSGLGGLHNQVDASDTRNDLALCWSPSHHTYVIAIYLTGCKLPATARDNIIADTTKAVIVRLAH